MQIDKSLFKEINDFCVLNGFNTKEFINSKLKEILMTEKYGQAPFLLSKKTQINEVKQEIPDETNKCSYTILNNNTEEKIIEPHNPICNKIDNIKLSETKIKKTRKLS